MQTRGGGELLFSSRRKEDHMKKAIVLLLIVLTGLLIIGAAAAQEAGGADGPALNTLPEEVRALMEESGGKVVIEDFVADPNAMIQADLTTYFPLVDQSWWEYGGFYVSTEGSGPLSDNTMITEIKEYGGIQVAGFRDTDGVIYWQAWQPLGLLLIYEEMPDDWSGVYEKALYAVYTQMSPGETCSGDTRVLEYDEPEHVFVGFGKHKLVHTLIGFATVTVPESTYEECAIFRKIAFWKDSDGTLYLERGVIVHAPNVGRIAGRLRYWETWGGFYWEIVLSYLESYSIP